MKIPRGVPQFNDEIILLIVSGRQDATFYRVSDGFIDRLENFKIPTPHYSDHEGEFKTRGRGIVMSSGAIRELQDEDIIRDFIKEFRKKIKNSGGFTKIYIFAPDQTKYRIVKVLPREWQSKIRKTIDGNYYYRHPLTVLKKISQVEAHLSIPLDPEAQKILKRPEYPEKYLE